MLLEADAAQPRPVLMIQERLAVKEVLKAFLELDKKAEIGAWISTLIFGGLLGGSLHWLWKRFYRTPVDDTDFSKVHKPNPKLDWAAKSELQELNCPCGKRCQSVTFVISCCRQCH